MSWRMQLAAQPQNESGSVLIPILVLAAFVVPSLIASYALGTAQESQARVLKDEYYNRARFQLNGVVQRAIPIVLRDSRFSSCTENSDCKATLQTSLSNAGISICTSSTTISCILSITTLAGNRVRVTGQINQSYLEKTGTWILGLIAEYQLVVSSDFSRPFGSDTTKPASIVDLFKNSGFPCSANITTNSVSCPSSGKANIITINEVDDSKTLSLQDFSLNQGILILNFCSTSRSPSNTLKVTDANPQTSQNGQLFITSICPNSSSLDGINIVSNNANASIIAPNSTVSFPATGAASGYYYAKRFTFNSAIGSSQIATTIFGSLASLSAPDLKVTSGSPRLGAKITPSKNFDSAASQFFTGLVTSNHGFVSSDSATCSTGQIKVYVADIAGTPSASPSCQSGSIAPSTPSLPQASGGSGTPKFTRILKTALSSL